ncbi:MAG TPA: hypothetical protein VGG75_06285 [Trebonia sp.]
MIDEFYAAKFTGIIKHPAEYLTDESGKRVEQSKPWTEHVVRADWSHAEWLAERHAGLKKTTTKGAYTS